MAIHKYRIGQLVLYMPGKLQQSVPAGDFKITRLLPADGAELQYRIKSAAEPFERIARESQLTYRSRS